MSYYVPAKHLSKYIVSHNIPYDQFKQMITSNKIIILHYNRINYWHTSDNKILRVNLTKCTKEYYKELLQYNYNYNSGYIIIPEIKKKSIFKFNGDIIHSSKHIEIECMFDDVLIIFIINDNNITDSAPIIVDSAPIITDSMPIMIDSTPITPDSMPIITNLLNNPLFCPDESTTFTYKIFSSDPETIVKVLNGITTMK